MHSADQSVKRIDDLPNEIILLIYENLDLNSLINVVKSYPSHRMVAGSVVKNTLNLKMVNFDRQRFHGSCREHAAEAFNSLTEILTIFGHIIETIRIDYTYFDSVRIEQLNRIIDESNLESLFQIELKNCTETIFKSLPNRFKSVENVCLSGIVNSDDINLNELFPEVRQLDINELSEISSANIEHHFTYLEEMHVEGGTTTDSPSFEQRIRLNPQLRSLKIASFTWHGLKQTSELLMNLEKLTVYHLKGEEQFDGTINFSNLKYFHLKELPRSVERIPITCTTLEKLKTNYVNRWFDVVIQNKNLREIICGDLTDEQFQRIGKEFPNLTKLHTSYEPSNTDHIDIVLRFYEASKNLQRIRFICSNREIINAIDKSLKRNWTLTQVMGAGFASIVFIELRTDNT